MSPILVALDRAHRLTVILAATTMELVAERDARGVLRAWWRDARDGRRWSVGVGEA